MIQRQLTGSDLTLNLDINANDFTIINKQFSEYYRITYDEQNWSLITDYFEQIPPLTKVVVLNDRLFWNTFKFKQLKIINF